jgi:hypothetical protein
VSVESAWRLPIKDWSEGHSNIATNPASIYAADNSSEIVFHVHPEGPVFRLIVIDVTAEAMRCVVSNRVRSKKRFTLELVV